MGIFLDGFQFTTGTMDHATISNQDITINLGYHGNLKNVSLDKNLAYYL